MTSTAHQDLWELASVIAFERLGLIPLSRVEGVCLPPTEGLAKLSPEEGRKARRKYRKLWRKELARRLREYEKTPLRRRDAWRWTGAHVRGKWKCSEDPFTGMLILIRALEVGKKPSASARGYRWAKVKHGDEYDKILLKVARELGLRRRRGSM